MAGPLTQPIPIHARPQAAPQPRLRPMVEASLTMMGRTYRTNIREGASVEGLIEQVARENGGWVSKKYYPEFKTWEIVAVKIGDQLLVKSSDAGIHFFLGESGIPLAVTEKQGIVFPNMEELRIGKNARNVSLGSSSETFDPKNIPEMVDRYRSSGGLILSQDAKEKLAQAHGGVRSDKLMLEENILVLNRDTGEVLTISQHASNAPDFQPSADPFVFTSQVFQPPPAVPQNHDFMHPNDMIGLGILNDASPSRIPYLIVKTFDGRLSDQVFVQFNPFGSRPDDNAAQPDVRSEQLRITGPPKLAFSVLTFKPPNPEMRRPDVLGQADQTQPCPACLPADPGKEIRPRDAAKQAWQNPSIPTRKPQNQPSVPEPAAILGAWLRPRWARLELDVPFSVSAPTIIRPGIIRAMPREPQKKKSLSARPKEKPAPERAKKDVKIKKAIPRELKPEKKSAREKQKSMESVAKRKKKSAAERRWSTPLADSSGREKAKRTFGKHMPIQEPGLCQEKKQKSQLRTQSMHGTKKPKKRGPAPQAPNQAQTKRSDAIRKILPRDGKRKKIPKHLLDQMLGLAPQWKSKGRKFRMKKNRAV